jgi:hypothetical protein
MMLEFSRQNTKEERRKREKEGGREGEREREIEREREKRFVAGTTIYHSSAEH